jgi:predicted GIY-YIG superfamily endonuclease
MHTLYILLCADESYYTSITRHLSRRLKQHHEGKVIYTAERLPV